MILVIIHYSAMITLAPYFSITVLFDVIMFEGDQIYWIWHRLI